MRWYTLEELCESETARRKGLANVPGPRHRAALEALVDRVLDPLRDAVGRPVRVTSGYRSAAVNAATGGAKDSQHARGEAADVKVTGYSSAELARLVLRLGLPVDQMIAYAPSRGGHLHVSYRAIPRGDVRHAPTSGGYPPGLPEGDVA